MCARARARSDLRHERILIIVVQATDAISAGQVEAKFAIERAIVSSDKSGYFQSKQVSQGRARLGQERNCGRLLIRRKASRTPDG